MMIIIGFIVGVFFVVAIISCLMAAHKGDEQGRMHSDTYEQGFEDGYAEGLNDARWKGERVSKKNVNSRTISKY